MNLSKNRFRAVGCISLCTVALTVGWISTLRANDCSRDADPDLAIQACTDAIIDGYINRGIAYGAKGNHERAVADFEKALQLGKTPTSGECANARGTALRKSGDQGERCQR